MTTVSDPQILLRVTFEHVLETGVCLLFSLNQHFLSAYCVQRRASPSSLSLPCSPHVDLLISEDGGGVHVCVHAVPHDLLGLSAGTLDKHVLSTTSVQGGARPQPSEPVPGGVRAEVPRASVKDAS